MTLLRGRHGTLSQPILMPRYRLDFLKIEDLRLYMILIEANEIHIG